MAVTLEARLHRMNINEAPEEEKTPLIGSKRDLLECFQKINCVPRKNRERAALFLTPDLISNYIRKGSDVNAEDNQGHTPLHYAAKLNRSDLIARLLFYGATIDAQDSVGYTPLHISSYNGHLENVRVFLENNANANLKCFPEQQLLALHIASKQGHPEVVKLLLPKTENPLQSTLKGATALSLAADGGFAKIGELITNYVTSHVEV